MEERVYSSSRNLEWKDGYHWINYWSRCFAHSQSFTLNSQILLKSKEIIEKRFSSDFSDCGFYRWSLQREISFQKKKIIFVGLNPSNANDFRNDQTLRKLLGFCNSWDYGHLVVVNLFARISSSPSKLKDCQDPIGIRNNCELNNRFGVWANNEDWDIWLGWGTKGTFHARNKEVLRVLNDYLIISLYFKV